MYHPCKKIDTFDEEEKNIKDKHVVCLKHCNPSGSVKKNKIKIENLFARH